MKKQKLLAYSRDFQKMYFSKDLFLIPYYVAKQNNMDLEFLFGMNIGDTEIPCYYRGVTIKSLGHKYVSPITEFIDAIKYIFVNAKHIDTLFVVGISFLHLLRVCVFKFLNPKANVIIFGDMEPEQAKEIVATDFYRNHTLVSLIKQKLADSCFKDSLFLVANPLAFSILKQEFQQRGWNGLLHFYPCLDDEKYREYGVKRKSFEEKENIMVCVGRIGNHQKNTEMLLDALKLVDLKEWKIYMIGPITNTFNMTDKGNFQRTIDIFFENFPEKKNKLIFTGMIYDQKKIFEHYNRAKVLIMTSRHESFGNVYSEAAAYGCYILSTEVGGAQFTSNDWQFGTKIEQEDSDSLAIALNNIVNKNLQFRPDKAIAFESLCYSNLTKSVINPKLN